MVKRTRKVKYVPRQPGQVSQLTWLSVRRDLTVVRRAGRHAVCGVTDERPLQINRRGEGARDHARLLIVSVIAAEPARKVSASVQGQRLKVQEETNA